jgi:hypothetical protein
MPRKIRSVGCLFPRIKHSRCERVPTMSAAVEGPAITDSGPRLADGATGTVDVAGLKDGRGTRGHNGAVPEARLMSCELDPRTPNPS